MCGIFGAFRWDDHQVTCGPSMANALRHRGPDADGMHAGPGILLGNTRLSILDLTEASNQPIYSDDGDLVVVQNGEIYNYLELREVLRRAGYSFRSNGDTEVLLHGFDYWGPDVVHHLNGMFAFAVYRISTQTLWLFRDRLGVKPLYLAGDEQSGVLWFGSEIKAILTNGQRYSPNLSSLAQFFALNYIPAPDTIFQGIHHLMPGCRAKIDRIGGVKIERYWDLNAVSPEKDISPADVHAGLVRLLDDATRIRMRSDAAFGAFLSGGLDSASVVGMMSLYQKAPIRTYSIGFSDPRFDETYWARRVAARFGSYHQVHMMKPDLEVLWPQMIWNCDQPHGDISFIPTGQVSALAAREVRMVLTGDGGDELFGGYEKYLQVFPQGKADQLEPDWENAFARGSGLLTGSQADWLLTGDLAAAFSEKDPFSALSDPIKDASHQDPINRVLLAETLTLLPGNNLVKPDRMAMAHGLEVRSPFLDYRMAEFAFQIPGALKLSGGRTKAVYKDAMIPLLGREIVERKKQMFTVPVGEWFRDALASYCRSCLLDGRLEARNLFSGEGLRRIVDEHLGGHANHTRQLRALIATELWFRRFEDLENTPANLGKTG
ncbi:asparagine synthase (glutamine-hydrolyzing) [Rhodophyticola sp. CCM32]|uniref:asparagine synthase (glutamine-hydrolyzing) n=1 Tax=Rhodophyticola sp. CCM32 TaxID=2916397 RepID=UPI00107F7A01|nr:asparagine synthase (glutamine-hydrolyzing) [Rhodophyticola sp. CCM32]QBY01297.1 asparagine synthase (glutamine-hydrolyzing) [Rhodophyticola sp. CCM32]